MGKKASLKNGAGLTGYLNVEECKYINIFYPAQNSSYKWIKELNIKPDKLNLIKEKVGNSLEHISTGNLLFKSNLWYHWTSSEMSIKVLLVILIKVDKGK